MAILWGGGFIVGKMIAGQAGPFTISFLRFFIATAVLAVLVYKKEKYIKIDWPVLANVFGAAFLGIFCYNFLFLSGIKLIDASRGSVIMSTVPMVVGIFSYVVFKEKINFIRSLGIVLSIIGASVVITKGKLGVLFSQGIGKGEIDLIVCVFCATAYALFSKQVLDKVSPLMTMTYITGVGAILSFVPAVIEIQHTPVQFFSHGFLFCLFYLALGPSVIAVIFYYEAISSVGATRASQYMNLMPVFAVALAFIFLGEHPSSSLLVGGGLVTFGLYLNNFT